MKVKNKKFNNLEKKNAKTDPIEKYEVETWCGEFLSGMEKKPKRCRRKLSKNPEVCLDRKDLN